MSEKLKELDLKLIELKKLEDQRSNLITKQEQILEALWNEKKEIAKKIKENRYFFSHPTIQYKSTRGPILGYSSKENKLYVFEVENGIKEIDMYSDDVKISWWRQIIELGMFEDAYNGLTYIDCMIDNYISNLQKANEELESEIKTKE